MKINIPTLVNFNIDYLALTSGNSTVNIQLSDRLPSKSISTFQLVRTNKNNLFFQKFRNRYEYLRQLEPLTPCDHKCPEDKYFDCQTETCKEYPYEGYFTT